MKQRASKSSSSRKGRALEMRLKEAGGVGSSGSNSHGPVPSIELYQQEACPSSHAVRSRLTELGLDFIAHNVPEGNELKIKQLVEAGGKYEFPFLIDHRTGVKLYESTAIIEYLESEYGDGLERGFVGLLRRAQSRLQTQSDELTWVLRRNIDRMRELRGQAGETLKLTRDSLSTVIGSVRRAFEAEGSRESSDEKAAG